MRNVRLLFLTLIMVCINPSDGFGCGSGRYKSCWYGCCKSCSTGRYQNYNFHNSYSCKSCGAGQYQNYGGQSSCKYCSAGQYQNYGGQSSCKSCGAGQYQNSGGQSSCKSCGAGQYQNQNRQSSCKSCGAGQYQNQNRQSGCKSCGAGQYQNQNRQSSCKSCSIGQYQNYGGQSSCKACGIGKYQGSSRQSSCNSCAAGQYQNQFYQTSCKSCSSGQYQNYGGQSSCKACGIGYYQNSGGQSGCKACSVGYYQNYGGQSSCKACGIGYYQNSGGQSGCKACDSGKYQSQNAQTSKSSCKKCQTGKFQNNVGQSSCKTCPSGYYQSVSRTACWANCPNIIGSVSNTEACFCGTVGECSANKFCYKDYFCSDIQNGEFIFGALAETNDPSKCSEKDVDGQYWKPIISIELCEDAAWTAPYAWLKDGSSRAGTVTTKEYRGSARSIGGPYSGRSEGGGCIIGSAWLWSSSYTNGANDYIRPSIYPGLCARDILPKCPGPTVAWSGSSFSRTYTKKTCYHGEYCRSYYGFERSSSPEAYFQQLCRDDPNCNAYMFNARYGYGYLCRTASKYYSSSTWSWCKEETKTVSVTSGCSCNHDKCLSGEYCHSQTVTVPLGKSRDQLSADEKVCRGVPPCTDGTGSVDTGGSCVCNRRTCGSGEKYCNFDKNVCSEQPNPTCTYTSGQNENDGRCICGDITCVDSSDASSGLYCTIDGNGKGLCVRGKECGQGTDPCLCENKLGLENNGECDCGTVICASGDKKCIRTLNQCSANGIFNGNGIAYQKMFDGECNGGTEIRMYEGDADNPGTDEYSRIQACADACLNKKTPLSGSWSGFVAKGFIVTVSGRCYCENIDSSSCSIYNQRYYDRYDFFTGTAPACEGDGLQNPCFCNNIVCGDENKLFCSSSEPLCKSPPVCSNTNLGVVVDNYCRCGSTTCKGGEYCDSALSICSVYKGCIGDGFTENNYQCQCGRNAVCDAGSYCLASRSICFTQTPYPEFETCAAGENLVIPSSECNKFDICQTVQCDVCQTGQCYTGENCVNQGNEENFGHCLCSGNEICTTQIGLYCNHPSRSGYCSSGPTCSNTIGTLEHESGCNCDGNVCNRVNGLYCFKDSANSANSFCSDLPRCESRNGIGQNSEECQCGTSRCAANLWCMAEYDFCAVGPECDITKKGAEQNTGPCRCGPNTNCEGDKLGCEPDWPTNDGTKARCLPANCPIEDGSSPNDNECMCGTYAECGVDSSQWLTNDEAGPDHENELMCYSSYGQCSKRFCVKNELIEDECWCESSTDGVMCPVNQYCNDGYCTDLPSCSTGLNEIKLLSERCICSDVSITDALICDAGKYCFREDHSGSSAGMVTAVVLASSSHHARCLDEPFCESLDGLQQNSHACLCARVNQEHYETCNSGEYCFAGKTPGQSAVSYCSTTQTFSEGIGICNVGENTVMCLCGSEECSDTTMFCNDPLNGECTAAPNCNDFGGDVATTTTCFAGGDLYCNIGQYPYDSDGQKHCLDYPLCIHKALSIPNTELCTCWADDSSSTVMSCDDNSPFCWADYRRCVPQKCTTDDKINSERCLCGLAICDPNSACVNGQCGAVDSSFNNFVIEEQCTSETQITSSNDCKLAAWSYEINRPSFSGNRNPFESQLEQSPFWRSESDGTCRLSFSPLSEELDAAGLVVNQNTEIYHKFTTSGSCVDVEGWEDIKTFDECKSSFEALVEQNKRDSSASSVLDQINNIQMVHADLISNWPMGEYANLDDFDTGCVVDVGNNLLYFKNFPLGQETKQCQGGFCLCKYTNSWENICKTSGYPICEKLDGTLDESNTLDSSCWCNSEICNSGDHCTVNGCIVANCGNINGNVQNSEKCQCGETKCDIDDYCSADFDVCSKISTCGYLQGRTAVGNRCQCGKSVCEPGSYCNQENSACSTPENGPNPTCGAGEPIEIPSTEICQNGYETIATWLQCQEAGEILDKNIGHSFDYGSYPYGCLLVGDTVYFNSHETFDLYDPPMEQRSYSGESTCVDSRYSQSGSSCSIGNGGYVEIDLLEEMEVKGVYTKGSHISHSTSSSDLFQTFKVEYSIDGNSWSLVDTFDTGRTSSSSGILTEFDMIQAKYIRVNVLTHPSANVRVAIYAKESKYEVASLCKAEKPTEKCQCDKELCGEGLFCIEGNCADKPRCIVKDGSAINPLDCQCGQSECLDPNRFCYETLEVCSDSLLFEHSSGKNIPICPDKNANVKNTEECICGQSICAPNEFCFEDFNACSDVAKCGDNEALISNGPDKCMCGATNCEGTDSFCLESESTCAKGSQCTYANGKYKNSGLGCICGGANCEGDDMFCVESESRCAKGPKCEDNTGLEKNIDLGCMCGATNCEGDDMFCVESESRCAKGPFCQYTGGININSGLGCMCGATNCEGEDMYCHPGDICKPWPVCENQDGSEMNVLTGCLCGNVDCEGMHLFCNIEERNIPTSYQASDEWLALDRNQCGQSMNCANVDGTTINDDMCRCGTVDCPFDKKFCIKREHWTIWSPDWDICSDVAICANRDRTQSLEQDCQCGLNSKCSTGQYCDGYGACHDTPMCQNTHGQLLNTETCMCYKTYTDIPSDDALICGQSTPYCYADDSRCSGISHEIEVNFFEEVVFMKTCDYSDGIFAHETSTSCRCGKTAICDANVGMICDGTKCSRQNDCLQTNGLKPNDGGCRCGPTVCSSLSGYFCLLSIETCSIEPMPPCSKTEGLYANSQCMCPESGNKNNLCQDGQYCKNDQCSSEKPICPDNTGYESLDYTCQCQDSICPSGGYCYNGVCLSNQKVDCIGNGIVPNEYAYECYCGDTLTCPPNSYCQTIDGYSCSETYEHVSVKMCNEETVYDNCVCSEGEICDAEGKAVCNHEHYLLQTTGKCSDPITSFDECTAANLHLNPGSDLVSDLTSETDVPFGCSRIQTEGYSLVLTEDSFRDCSESNTCVCKKAQCEYPNDCSNMDGTISNSGLCRCGNTNCYAENKYCNTLTNPRTQEITYHCAEYPNCENSFSGIVCTCGTDTCQEDEFCYFETGECKKYDYCSKTDGSKTESLCTCQNNEKTNVDENEKTIDCPEGNYCFESGCKPTGECYSIDFINDFENIITVEIDSDGNNTLSPYSNETFEYIFSDKGTVPTPFDCTCSLVDCPEGNYCLFGICFSEKRCESRNGEQPIDERCACGRNICEIGQYCSEYTNTCSENGLFPRFTVENVQAYAMFGATSDACQHFAYIHGHYTNALTESKELSTTDDAENYCSIAATFVNVDIENIAKLFSDECYEDEVGSSVTCPGCIVTNSTCGEQTSGDQCWFLCKEKTPSLPGCQTGENSVNRQECLCGQKMAPVNSFGCNPKEETWSMPEDCIDGENDNACYCNGNLCGDDTGIYCHQNISRCSPDPCIYNTGVFQNNERCFCGPTDCEAGQYCTLSMNRCFDHPQCIYPYGKRKTDVECTCGRSECKVDEYCFGFFHQCSSDGRFTTYASQLEQPNWYQIQNNESCLKGANTLEAKLKFDKWANGSLTEESFFIGETFWSERLDLPNIFTIPLEEGDQPGCTKINNEITFSADSCEGEHCIVEGPSLPTCDNAGISLATHTSTDSCLCGINICTTETGFVCDLIKSECSHVNNPCVATYGNKNNGENCRCGDVDCNDGTGTKCIAQISQCSTNIFVLEGPPRYEGIACDSSFGKHESTSDCVCGTTSCSPLNGHFCNARNSICSMPDKTCEHIYGSRPNTESCLCGKSSCNSAAPYCNVDLNTCSENTRDFALFKQIPHTEYETCENFGMTDITDALECKKGSVIAIDNPTEFFIQGTSDTGCVYDELFLTDYPAKTYFNVEGMDCFKHTCICKIEAPICVDVFMQAPTVESCICGSEICEEGYLCDAATSSCTKYEKCKTLTPFEQNDVSCACGGSKIFEKQTTGPSSLSIKTERECFDASLQIIHEDTLATQKTLKHITDVERPMGCFLSDFIYFNEHETPTQCSETNICIIDVTKPISTDINCPVDTTPVCDAENNLCRDIQPCEDDTGIHNNNGICTCGDSICDSESGLMCNQGQCSKISTCHAFDSITINTKACLCGPYCEGSDCFNECPSGSFCTIETGFCSNYAGYRGFFKFETTCSDKNAAGLVSISNGTSLMSMEECHMDIYGYDTQPLQSPCNREVCFYAPECLNTYGYVSNQDGCQCKNGNDVNYCDPDQYCSTECHITPLCNFRYGWRKNQDCSCGSEFTQCSDSLPYCVESESKCYADPICQKTEGLLTNGQQCACGSERTICTQETGFYCHADISRCSHRPCENNYGLIAETQQCACGEGDCNANKFCFKPDNFCGGQQCLAKDGFSSSANPCVCGNVMCASGLHCYANSLIPNLEINSEDTRKRLTDPENQCRITPMCQHTDGKIAEPVECTCGRATCQENEFCYEDHDRCGAWPFEIQFQKAETIHFVSGIPSVSTREPLCSSTNCNSKSTPGTLTIDGGRAQFVFGSGFPTLMWFDSDWNKLGEVSFIKKIQTFGIEVEFANWLEAYINKDDTRIPKGSWVAFTHSWRIGAIKQFAGLRNLFQSFYRIDSNSQASGANRLYDWNYGTTTRSGVANNQGRSAMFFLLRKNVDRSMIIEGAKYVTSSISKEVTQTAIFYPNCSDYTGVTAHNSLPRTDISNECVCDVELCSTKISPYCHAYIPGGECKEVPACEFKERGIENEHTCLCTSELECNEDKGLVCGNDQNGQKACSFVPCPSNTGELPVNGKCECTPRKDIYGEICSADFCYYPLDAFGGTACGDGNPGNYPVCGCTNMKTHTCTYTNGNKRNQDMSDDTVCRCGSSTCLRNDYCNEEFSVCSKTKIPSCAYIDGDVVNTLPCLCGNEFCGEGGYFCNATRTQNKCHKKFCADYEYIDNICAQTPPECEQIEPEFVPYEGCVVKYCIAKDNPYPGCLCRPECKNHPLNTIPRGCRPYDAPQIENCKVGTNPTFGNGIRTETTDISGANVLFDPQCEDTVCVNSDLHVCCKECSGIGVVVADGKCRAACTNNICQGEYVKPPTSLPTNSSYESLDVFIASKNNQYTGYCQGKTCTNGTGNTVNDQITCCIPAEKCSSQEASVLCAGEKYTGNLIDNYCPEFECSPDGCCEEISCFCNNGLPEVGRNCPNPGDYKCKACFENYWLSGIECIQARTCVPGLQYELIPPAEESDRICASLKSCNSLQYESQAPTFNSDRICTDLTVCTTEQYESQEPEYVYGFATPITDRICSPLTVCNATQYQSKAPESLDIIFKTDRECTQHSDPCPTDKYQSIAPSDMVDRECLPYLGECLEFEYESKSPTNISNRECTAYSAECSILEYESVAKTDFSDRDCVTLTTCDNSQFESQAPVMSDHGYYITNRQCDELTLCMFDEFQYQSPIFSNGYYISDRICNKLNTCNDEQYEFSPPTAIKDRECRYCEEDDPTCKGCIVEDDCAHQPDAKVIDMRKCSHHTCITHVIDDINNLPSLRAGNWYRIEMNIDGDEFNLVAPNKVQTETFAYFKIEKEGWTENIILNGQTFNIQQDCLFEPYTWGQCSNMCGQGLELGVRGRKIQEAEHGGLACSETPVTIDRPCNGTLCPINCEVIWDDEFQSCPAKCGDRGIQIKNYTIAIHPMYNGNVCPPVMKRGCVGTPPLEYCDCRNRTADACGVCGGDGKTCKGCDGVPNSGKIWNLCGDCVEPGVVCKLTSKSHLKDKKRRSDIFRITIPLVSGVVFTALSVILFVYASKKKPREPRKIFLS